MTINAVLQRLVLASPQEEQLASFYGRAFDYQVTVTAGEYRCEAPGRSLWLRKGAANQLLASHFVFSHADSLNRYVTQLQTRGAAYGEKELNGASFLMVHDPDGREVWFGAADSYSAPVAGATNPARPARLQHYALRSPTPQTLVDFYANILGFTVSDLVRDDAGDLTAAFLRTDSEHHALAIFRAPERRFDHFSCETSDWNALRDWADYMGRNSVKLAWGVGRHGPGNDTFFMVYDPDGNLAEISSDLELCAEDRPVGLWKHRMETLNQWGIAIMRS
jgi:catechol 2,3-dioxygenase-like lactoylglutathione lyase family enzyme